MPVNDITSQRFGNLLVVGRAGSNARGAATWNCICSCGNSAVIAGCNLRGGNTSSCGCIRKANVTTHGHTVGGKRTKIYRIWCSMIERCSREKNPFYKDYGGRGISVCDRWKDFANFLADVGEPPKGMSLDRYPDCDGNYEPSNCRWATNNEQQNNRRNNRRIEIDGETKTVADWCRDRALPYGRVAMRLHTGWTD